MLEESLRQPSLAITFDIPVACWQIPERMGLDPITDSEVRILGHKEFRLHPRLFQSTKLSQCGGQETPGAGAIYGFVAEGLHRRFILASGELAPSEIPIVPGWLARI